MGGVEKKKKDEKIKLKKGEREREKIDFVLLCTLLSIALHDPLHVVQSTEIGEGGRERERGN